MRLKKIDLVIYLMIMFVVGFLGAFVGIKIIEPKIAAKYEFKDHTITEQVPSDPRLNNIAKSLDLIKKHFIEEVGEEQLLEGAIEGMLATLGDPYSSYLNAEAMERFNEQIYSSFEGIGAEVSMINGKVTIVSPIKDSPAEKSGLRPNDIILSVNNELVEGYNLNEVVERIRGKKGSEVTLLVQRGTSTEPFEITIVRDEIPIETVYSSTEIIDGKKTGIIEITSFSERTAEEFIEQLHKLEDDGMEGLVIDVRGNPGGLLNAVVDILEQFMPNDLPIIQTEDRNGKRNTVFSKLKEKKQYPITVVIDEGSASASEILAIAMKEIGYEVVGTSSFGKGTVQQAVELGDGSTVKLTFYKWLSPKGNWINEVGVEPTIEQSQPDFYYVSPITVDESLQFDQLGDKVKSVQTMLSGLGYDLKRTDGYFDHSTEEAVKQFQQKNNLTVNGIVDGETYGKIEEQIITLVRNGEQDLQLQKALQSLYK